MTGSGSAQDLKLYFRQFPAKVLLYLQKYNKFFIIIYLSLIFDSFIFARKKAVKRAARRKPLRIRALHRFYLCTTISPFLTTMLTRLVPKR